MDHWCTGILVHELLVGRTPFYDEDEYQWTKAFSTEGDSTEGQAFGQGLSVCGSADYADSGFSNIVDVSTRHTGDKLRVTFGTTNRLGEGSSTREGTRAYWGVSSVSVWAK